MRRTTLAAAVAALAATLPGAATAAEDCMPSPGIAYDVRRAKATYAIDLTTCRAKKPGPTTLEVWIVRTDAVSGVRSRSTVEVAHCKRGARTCAAYVELPHDPTEHAGYDVQGRFTIGGPKGRGGGGILMTSCTSVAGTYAGCG